jgi:hypothetical protein
MKSVLNKENLNLERLWFGLEGTGFGIQKI